MTRRPFLHRVALVAALGFASACTPCSQSTRVPEPGLERMLEAPRADPLEESRFFADGTNVRAAPAGAVAFGEPPMQPPLSAALLDEGEERFNVMCAACHGLVGDGDSVVARHMTLVKPRDLHIERLRQQPARYFFDIATRGFGLMPGYADRLSLRERWAVAHYVKALQVARDSAVTDAPDDVRRFLTRDEKVKGTR